MKKPIPSSKQIKAKRVISPKMTPAKRAGGCGCVRTIKRNNG
ncbi:hypothetical protein [Saccharococcus caldoxylosilyticus]|uniref:Uncharacterized protein n=1 Tax=Saccharococcus caldoxylosilyticus TaxID=81408 RepID=A0A150LET9_9BACL|nr:hypothetical protein [Parageobacillus caldoxylosilyticus]KYD10539.1 hypothetical protein B4119_0879 [Parageobacillus caldoxylosilyticus]